MNSEKFKCEMCLHVLVDPVVPECGKSACHSHFQYSDAFLSNRFQKNKRRYICEICNKDHDTFNVFKISMPTLKFDPILTIAEAKETVKRMSNTDPESLVYEYFEDIKRQVVLRREELKIKIHSDSYKMAKTKMRRKEFKIKINEYSEELINSIAKTQSECMESANKVNETGMVEAFKEKLLQTIEKYEEMTISEEEFERINREILELKFKCDRILTEYSSSIFSEKKYELTAGTFTKTAYMLNVGVSKLFGSFRRQLDRSTEINAFDSKIIQQFQYRLYFWCLFDDQRWKLIYRGSRDGFSAKAFHSKCDGIQNTLTVIKATDGDIFGGFTTKPWTSDNRDIEDPSAFVFSLVNQLNDPYKRNLKKGKSAIRCSPSKGPCFGDGDICIASDSNINKHSYYNLYRHNNNKTRQSTILARSYQFRTSEVEVFARREILRGIY